MIPIVEKPLPDELLSSWVYRLSKKNGLNCNRFAEAYLNEKVKNPSQLVDIRYGYSSFIKYIHEAIFKRSVSADNDISI